MDKTNRPRGREKNVTGAGKGVYKRGDGLNTGPVGESKGYAGRKEQTYQSSAQTGRQSVKRSSRSPMSAGIALIVVLAALFGGGNGLTSLFGGSSGTTSTISAEDLLSGTSSLNGSYSTGNTTTNTTSSSSTFGTPYVGAANTATLNRDVAAGSRDKYTTILGNKQDVITMMVFMCGTDLESRSRMASSDIQEMLQASFGDNINLILYTGGCSRWQNNIVSNQTNQIYQVKDGQLIRLVNDVGAKAMVRGDTLTEFINYCTNNFPANRNMLIFWDHGGGSVSGYGYDEKFQSAGSMTLADINTALKNAGTRFDMVGFDACLMATLETGLMLNEYADYLIASEETEPGIGWYYTNWLTELGKNTSMPTIEIGKNIIDEFIRACNQNCRGQSTTLSIVDLAELSNTVPDKFVNFSKSLTEAVKEDKYQTISDARYNTREFARSTKIDQVDLVNLAENIGTSEAKSLATVLKNAVKYNRTSSNMTNANGISIYFPSRRTSSVDKAVNIYENIGLDDSYSDAIRECAAISTVGQISAGGSASPLPSLLGTLMGGSYSSSSSSYGGYSTSSSGGSADMISQMLGSFLGGGTTTSATSGLTSSATSSLIQGLMGSNTSFLSGRALSQEEQAQYVADHYFDPSYLSWNTNNAGEIVISMPDEQWDLVHELDLNMFYDDGEGFIDLGLDNSFTFDNDGNLIPETDRTWLSIEGQPVAYYHLDTTEEGEFYTITGRVPAYVNGDRMNLLLVFDSDTPEGYIAGAIANYADNETDTVAKVMPLTEGDTIEYICDYYSYEGNYIDSYYLGDPETYFDGMEISNTDVGGSAVICYRFTDIYNQEYWSESMRLD